MNSLRKFMKDAKNEDWEMKVAGQRVQIIKKDEYEGGKLRFGTEVISSKDGSITCLLGASPGASTATAIMLEVVQKAFPEIMNTPERQEKLKTMFPTWNTDITETLFKDSLAKANEALGLD